MVPTVFKGSLLRFGEERRADGGLIALACIRLERKRGAALAGGARL